jgi:hypothetical protein
MKSSILVSTSIGWLVGCATFKTNPDLDHEFSQKGQVLAQQTALTLSDKVDVNNWLENKFSVTASNQELSILKAQKKFQIARGFQCFEPYLFIISLGIIPVVCYQEYEIETEWTDVNGRKTNKVFKVTEDKVFGWVAIFVSILSEWKLGMGGAVESVVYDEVNRNAE